MKLIICDTSSNDTFKPGDEITLDTRPGQALHINKLKTQQHKVLWHTEFSFVSTGENVMMQLTGFMLQGGSYEKIVMVLE